MRKVLIFCFLFFVSCVSTFRHTNNVHLFNNEPVRWHESQFPLIITSDDSIDRNDEIALINSINVWNNRIGEDVFLYLGQNDGIPGNISFRQRDVEDTSPTVTTQAICWYRNEGHWMQRSIITIDILTSPKDSLYVLIHELGHSLGLEHDTYQQSIMYWSASQSGGRILTDDANFVRWQMNGGQ